jgi:hypothetical protein
MRRVEGTREMAQRPAAVGGSLDGDHVEAHPSRTDSLLAKPGGRTPDQPRPLSSVDRLLGKTEMPAAPGLHLHEDAKVPPGGHQIQLDTVGPDVAPDDAIPFARQVRRRERFPLRTEA